MQGIDLAVQKTRGLAEFVDTITATIPGDWVVDVSTALSLVKLADMHKALASGTRYGHYQPPRKDAGDWHLFKKPKSRIREIGRESCRAGGYRYLTIQAGSGPQKK